MGNVGIIYGNNGEELARADSPEQLMIEIRRLMIETEGQYIKLYLPAGWKLPEAMGFDSETNEFIEIGSPGIVLVVVYDLETQEELGFICDGEDPGTILEELGINDGEGRTFVLLDPRTGEHVYVRGDQL